MIEMYKCETNVIEHKCNYKIVYHLVTEDGTNFGMKSTMYKNNELKSTNLFILPLSRKRVESLIDQFCINHVFPQSYGDILADMAL